MVFIFEPICANSRNLFHRLPPIDPDFPLLAQKISLMSSSDRQDLIRNAVTFLQDPKVSFVVSQDLTLLVVL